MPIMDKASFHSHGSRFFVKISAACGSAPQMRQIDIRFFEQVIYKLDKPILSPRAAQPGVRFRPVVEEGRGGFTSVLSSIGVVSSKRFNWIRINRISTTILMLCVHNSTRSNTRWLRLLALTKLCFCLFQLLLNCSKCRSILLSRTALFSLLTTAWIMGAIKAVGSADLLGVGASGSTDLLKCYQYQYQCYCHVLLLAVGLQMQILLRRIPRNLPSKRSHNPYSLPP